MSLSEYNRAVEQLTECIAHDMRMGGYSEDLSEEIDRILASKKSEDQDAVEDMSLAAIIEVAAKKRASADISLDAIDKILDQWREEAAEDRAEARYEDIERTN